MVDDPNIDPNKTADGNTPFFEEDDFLAAERFDEFEDNIDPVIEKVNWKEVWDKNPSIKIFAVVAGLAVLLIGYMVFGGSDPSSSEDVSIVKQTAEVNQPPGTTELPPAYEEAIRQASEQRAELAAATEGSSIPTPIARPSERIEAPVQVEEVDPLSAWRREAEARRAEATSQQVSLPLDDVSPAPQLPDLPNNNLNNNNPYGNNPNAAFNQQPQEPVHPPLPTEPSPELIQALSQQMQQQLQTVMETQMPRESVVVNMNIQPGYNMAKYFPPENAQQGGPAGQTGAQGETSAQNVAAQEEQKKPIVPAGTIAYAQILTQANSDVPGPVLAEIASGPLLGGRAIGQFQVAQRHLVLQFNRVIKDGVEYQVQGYALDPGTTLPGVATRINNHYFSRVFLPAAARFIEGFAEAATRTNTQSTIVDGTLVTTSDNELDTKQQVMEGANRGAQEISRMLDQNAQRPRTIIVDAGTRIGLLFVTSVMDPNTQMTPQGGYGNNSALGLAGQAYNAYAGNTGGYNPQTGASQPSQFNYNIQPQLTGGRAAFR